MKGSKMRQFLKKVNQSKLFFDILLTIGIFFAAISLANYFGNSINLIGFGLGWFSSVLLLVAIKIMEMFSLKVNQFDFDHKLLQRYIPGLSSKNNNQMVRKEYAGLILILIFVAGWAIIQFVFLQMGILRQSNLIWLLLIAFFAMLLGMPRIKLVNSGFAELIQSMLIFGLLPVYAYLVICNEFHLIIILMSMPMALFYMAYHLVYSLAHFSEDQKNRRLNLLQKIGWKQGMFFHNIFILLGFVIYACIPLFDFSTKIFLNPLIVLPIGLVLIFMLYRIEHGKKPEWGSLIFLEKILIAMVFYFLLSAMILR